MNLESSLKEFTNQAKEAYANGDFVLAAQFYSDARKVLDAQGDNLLAAEMGNNQSVALLKAGKPKEALQATLGTDLVFEKAGDLHRQAISLGNQASALEALKKFKEAIAHFQKSADIFNEIGDKDSYYYVLKNISTIQLRMGNQLEAISSMNAALYPQKKLTFIEQILKKMIGIVFGFLR
jgi:tetratricopeptide (TPR) repeat protein